MGLIELKTDPTQRELRQFAVLALPAATIIIASLLWWRFAMPSVALALLAVAGLVALAGWARPAWLRPLYVGWMVAAFPLGWLIGHLMLALVFYGVLTPIGCVLRWCGRDPLQRRFEPERSSYWEPCRPGSRGDSERWFRQF